MLMAGTKDMDDALLDRKKSKGIPVTGREGP
jgi:hypothetical protein